MAFCSKCGAQIPDGESLCAACANPAAVPEQPVDAKDAEANKTMALLAYILFFIPLIAGAHKTSPFVKYHTNQATILWIAAIAYTIVVNIISAILTVVLFGLGIVGFLLNILSLAFVVLAILGIMNAINGKMQPLPVIGKFTIIK